MIPTEHMLHQIVHNKNELNNTQLSKVLNPKPIKVDPSIPFVFPPIRLPFPGPISKVPLTTTEVVRQNTPEIPPPTLISESIDIETPIVAKTIEPINRRRQKKARFTPDEDAILIQLVNKYGKKSWSQIASRMPGRTERQVRERYVSFLDPNVNKTPFTKEEDELLEKLIGEIGNKWVKIATYFWNRTDVALKSRYVTLQRQRARINGTVFNPKKQSE